MRSSIVRWNRLVDLAVRLNSRELGDAVVVRRKLLHTVQVLTVWPLMAADPRLVGLALLGSSGFVITTQRRLPYASLGMLTLLPSVRRPALGGAWVVFTAGDGLATIVGRLLGGPELPWNRAKTWSGSAGFLVASTVALLWFLRRWRSPAGAGRRLAMASLTSLAAAAVESLDIPLDDNYSVIVVAGAILEALSA
jgi:CDP-diglyceride synthetase